MKRLLKIGIIQQPCDASRENNIAKSLAGIKQATDKGAQLVVLQELHAGPYFCQTEDVANFEHAEPIPGPLTNVFSNCARELNVVLVISLFERRAAGVYHNSAVVIEKNGQIAGLYRKMHIPDDPGYYEKFYFAPGDTGFVPISTSAGVLGVMVCWDQWYPEAARLMALAGAEILIYPTAIGWNPRDDEGEKARQLDAWMTVQRGHAVANGIPVVAVNRTGFEPESSGIDGILFWGNSFVAGSQGELLAQASATHEDILAVDIDMNRSETVRQMWPFLRDRRIDAYGDIVRRFCN